MTENKIQVAVLDALELARQFLMEAVGEATMDLESTPTVADLRGLLVDAFHEASGPISDDESVATYAAEDRDGYTPEQARAFAGTCRILAEMMAKVE